MISAELDRARLEAIRARFPSLASRRPEAYRLAVDGVTPLRAVLFDVDFTLCRPGPELGPEGYAALGREHGLELDPARYDEARAAAIETAPAAIRSSTTTRRSGCVSRRIVRGMGGGRATARAMRRSRSCGRGSKAANFELYDDVAAGARRAARARAQARARLEPSRDLGAFVRHTASTSTPARLRLAREGEARADDLPGGARAGGWSRRRPRWSATHRGRRRGRARARDARGPARPRGPVSRTGRRLRDLFGAARRPRASATCLAEVTIATCPTG